MVKSQKNKSLKSLYDDPFQSPRAKPKHAFRQVNGETEQGLHNQILEANMRTRT